MKSTLFAVGAWLLLSQAAVWAEPTQFAFDPPVGSKGHEVVRRTLTILGDEPSSPPAYQEMQVLESDYTVTQEQGKRWLKMLGRRAISTVEGRLVSDPREAAVGQTLSIAFDQRAQILEITGTQEVAKQLQQTLGQAAPSPEQLAAQIRIEWNTYYGIFWAHVADHPVIRGVPWEDTERITAFFLPGVGPIAVTGHWQYLGRETPSPTSRARFHYEYTSQALPIGRPEALNAWLSTRLPKLASSVWSTVTLKSEGNWLVNPTALNGDELTEQTWLTLTAADPFADSLRVEVDRAVKLSE